MHKHHGDIYCKALLRELLNKYVTEADKAVLGTQSAVMHYLFLYINVNHSQENHLSTA